MTRSLALLPLLVLPACVVVHLPEPGEAMLAAALREDPAATLETLGAGRALVLDRCANCHAPPEPAATREAEWPTVYPKMVKRAELDEAEVRLVERYLRAGAELPEEPVTPGG